MQNMMKLSYAGIPVTIWFDRPDTVGWEESIRLESVVPNLAISPKDAADLVALLADEWALSAEENALLLDLGCGVDHVN